VDTEAAGYHRYLDRVCLIQLSTRSDTYLVDPLALEAISPLEPLLAAADVEVVFHDADYDLRLLDRDFGIDVRGLFDTRIAAQFLGEPGIGLASLVEKYVGVRLAKKFQRADWAQRPLPREMLEYAAEDTRHLPHLRDRMLDALEAAGRLHWAQEEFRIAEAARWEPSVDGDAYRRLKGTRDLRPRQLAALRELHAWRESVARARDAAPFRVMANGVLVEAARLMPASARELAAVPGLAPALARRYGEAMLAAIETARRLPESELPQRPRRSPPPPHDPTFEARLERLRAARDRVAEALGLDRGFLMPRHQLEDLARSVPQSREALLSRSGVRQWQVDALGKDLMRALRG
jgi:ribonuclease D